MDTAIVTYSRATGRWSSWPLPELDSPRTLVLAMGAPAIGARPELLKTVRRAYPQSQVIGCSTAGEIAGTTLHEDSLVVAVARFRHTDIATAAAAVKDRAQSFAAGRRIAENLASAGRLRGVLVLSEGLVVNGSQLVAGINSVLDDSVVVTGGLAGDGTAFERTWMCWGGRVQGGMVVAAGLYGDRIRIGHGSQGGWDRFGPEREVTSSESNVLYELGGRPALALYKEYLGDKAAGLPSTGLLFPLALRESPTSEKQLVRTLLGIDEEAQSMIFAGDVPQGWQAQLMKADFDRLITGAENAGELARDRLRVAGDSQLAIAISCVGRKLVLGERTEDELEAVQRVLPPSTDISGFYSYGEISPFTTGRCDLHNQTMTLTVLSEEAAPLRRRASGSSRPVAAQPPPPPQERPKGPMLRAVTDKEHGPPRADARSPRSKTVSRAETVELCAVVDAGGATALHYRVDEIDVISIAGTITDRFPAADIARRAAESVVFDLAEIDRVSPGGVRAWLRLVAELSARGEDLHLARCSEAIMSRLITSPSFAGHGRLLSFYAPYLCRGCGQPFDVLLDCEIEATAIGKLHPGDRSCGHCGRTGEFDADPSCYLTGVHSHLGAIPYELRTALSAVDSRSEIDRRPVEASYSDGETRVRVRGGAPARGFWSRLLEGADGALVVDLHRARSMSRDALEGVLARLLAGAGRADAVHLEGCPEPLFEHVAAHRLTEVTIRSAYLSAHCPSCDATRPLLVSADEAARGLRRLCRTCDTPLAIRDRPDRLQVLAARPGEMTRPEYDEDTEVVRAPNTR